MNNRCPKCSFDIKEEYNICPNCGYDLRGGKLNTGNINRVICNDCGQENLPEANYCSECGAKLQAAEKSTGSKKSSGRDQKISSGKFNKPAGSRASAGKNLSALQIFMIIAAVVIAAVIMLIGAGVFSSGGSIKPEAPAAAEQQPGADLNSLQRIGDLEKAVKANPDNAEITVELANLLFDSHLYDRAIIYYKKYLELKPGDTNARVDLGICFFNKSEYNQAIEEMEKALKYEPRHLMANFNLGIVNLNAGNIEKAKGWFKKVIEIEPNSEYAKKAEELLKSH